jgi:hypothetical protein
MLLKILSFALHISPLSVQSLQSRSCLPYVVKVRVTLRLAVYCQSVCLGIKHLETHNQRFFFPQLNWSELPFSYSPISSWHGPRTENTAPLLLPTILLGFPRDRYLASPLARWLLPGNRKHISYCCVRIFRAWPRDGHPSIVACTSVALSKSVTILWTWRCAGPFKSYLITHRLIGRSWPRHQLSRDWTVRLFQFRINFWHYESHRQLLGFLGSASTNIGEQKRTLNADMPRFRIEPTIPMFERPKAVRS